MIAFVYFVLHANRVLLSFWVTIILDIIALFLIFTDYILKIMQNLESQESQNVVLVFLFGCVVIVGIGVLGIMFRERKLCVSISPRNLDDFMNPDNRFYVERLVKRDGRYYIGNDEIRGVYLADTGFKSNKIIHLNSICLETESGWINFGTGRDFTFFCLHK